PQTNRSDAVPGVDNRNALADIDLNELMLEIVAEKTGYPREMLQPEMELEADLGVDSIKRVEILAEMEERVPQLPEVDTAEMAELRRLNEIIEYMQGLMGGREPHSQSSSSSSTEESEDDSESDPGTSGSATSASGSTESEPDTSGLARYAVRAVNAPASGTSMPGLSQLETVYITGDSGDLGPVLVETLQERGLNAELCDAVPEGAQAAIFLGGLASVDDIDDALAVNRHAFDAAKALVSGDKPSPKLFVTVQDTGGDFGLSGSAGPRAWLAGTAALAKTAAVEWTDTAVKAIDLSRNGRTMQVQADAIADEIFFGGPEVEVGLGAERVTLVGMPEAVDATGSATDVEIDEDSVIVVSGGARGVTATATIALAKRTQASFVLLGRTELVDEPAVCQGVEGDAALKRVLLEEAKDKGEMLTPRDLQSQVRHVLACREIRDTIARLDAVGSKARYVSGDVRDEEALSEAFSQVREDWGPITGLVHGAGVLADALIEKKTLEQFEFVVGTKTEGLRALLAATSDDPLDLICTFSSVAARSGNPGQSDYAMANEILNKVAAVERTRRGDACLVKSIGWGPWDGGMVTPTLKKHFEEQGVVLIPKDAGGQMFATEILDAPASDIEVVLGGSVSAEGINGTNLEEGISVDLHIDASTHPYLDSHRLKGVPVVPAMVVLDWFLRMARGCRPDLQVLRCRDMEVRNGIKLAGFDEDGDLLTLTARQAGSAAKPELEVELRGADDTLHYVAVVELGDTAPSPADDLAGSYAMSPSASDIPLEEAYDAGNLFHGPDFEVLTDIEGIDEGGGVANLKGSRLMDWPAEGWFADPAALDGALQIGLL
ncbi:MAG: SDR family NAD(P)-dependent oxidoreductase, partial [Persicimonas sp.]